MISSHTQEMKLNYDQGLLKLVLPVNDVATVSRMSQFIKVAKTSAAMALALSSGSKE